MAAKHPIEYARILLDLVTDLEKKELEQAVSQFVEFLYREGALRKAPYIIEEFSKLAREADGIVDIKIRTATKISKEMIQAISAAFGGHVNADTEEDAALIGGVVIERGNTILDASVRTQLERLHTTLS